VTRVSETLTLTIAYEGPDEDGWIAAQVIEIPGAISQGRSRPEARENVLDALRLMLETTGEETVVDRSASRETLHLVVD